MAKEIKTKHELEEIFASSGDEKLVMVRYHAPWCQPCKMLGKTIEEIESELDDVVIVGVNCDEADNELIEMNHVMTIPRIIYYKDGFVVGTTVGNLGKKELLEAIEENKKK